ncbi:phosphoadenosine phosphosulfate reductase family protein [Pyrobaculum neutrophilum]|uniref:Phosphoadenosine phosphosulfate reductase n=1 Tax=Pyrobaculum neutrophilum (strain DSM 2338 / JCM 9278 / NBRC 100436 / V24Sta) TaxID=444157 RepID=B1YDA1_PYRNV|nr:phosphoadenosine phosphosulfate reductase family protein [Pyrobaculum neutrophilum]ACB39764.1 phosphoadenosine phosphosulfate reductase [Pyrobaculum neutrophilum V24Sta]
MRLFWCEELNLPVLDPRAAADRCGSFTPVYITEPADPRPAFPQDIESIRRAVAYELGDEGLGAALIPSDEVVLLNKIPGYADQADEVVVRGRVVGHRFYDVLERRWRFRPLYEAVSTILKERRGYWAVVDMSELPEGYDIHPERVVEGNLPTEKYRHVAISTRDGRVHGVAKLFRGRRLHVVKSWRARPPLPPGRPSSLREAAELNRVHIERLAEEAVRFVREVAERYGKPVVVSYSGGKDSLVALDVVAKSGVKFSVFFNDTGLEPPETYENIKKIEERYGVEVVVGSAGDRFWKAIKLFGPPARDYRWCCKVIKLGPTTEALKSRFPQGYVSIVGQRGAESFQRAKTPRVSRSKWVAGSIVAAPLQSWTALEVWLYIVLNGLPYNRAYERGFDRLGCVVCPANELAELDMVASSYPEIYSRMEVELKSRFSDEEVKMGLWRWRGKIPGDMARWVKRERGAELPVRVKKTEGGVAVEMDAEPDPHTLPELLKMLDKAAGRKSPVKVEGGGGLWRISAQDPRLALDAAALVVRAAICGDCDLCVHWCPTGALRRTGPGRRFEVDEKRCVGCLLCSSACPAAQYLVYRA